MSTLAETYGEQPVPIEKERVVSRPSRAAHTTLSLPASLYHEQIQSLIQQIFLQPESASVRHVGLAATEDSAEIGQLCFEMAQMLAESKQYDVGLIDASPGSIQLETHLELTPPENPITAWPIAPHLWFVPRQNWMNGHGQINEQNTARLRELAAEFDYSILRCPSVSWLTTQVGRACDGLVLVLTAKKTRRLVARQIKEQLCNARAPLLGTVLRERPLPIPEALYRSL